MRSRSGGSRCELEGADPPADGGDLVAEPAALLLFPLRRSRPQRPTRRRSAGGCPVGAPLAAETSMQSRRRDLELEQELRATLLSLHRAAPPALPGVGEGPTAPRRGAAPTAVVLRRTPPPAPAHGGRGLTPARGGRRAPRRCRRGRRFAGQLVEGRGPVRIS
jgi:hypothetical protein